MLSVAVVVRFLSLVSSRRYEPVPRSPWFHPLPLFSPRLLFVFFITLSLCFGPPFFSSSYLSHHIIFYPVTSPWFQTPVTHAPKPRSPGHGTAEKTYQFLFFSLFVISAFHSSNCNLFSALFLSSVPPSPLFPCRTVIHHIQSLAPQSCCHSLCSDTVIAGNLCTVFLDALAYRRTLSQSHHLSSSFFFLRT